MVSDREQLMERMLEMLYAMMTSPVFGPLRQYTPEDMGRWPIWRGNGIPNCNTSLSILHSAAERPCPLRVDPLTQSVAWLGCGQLSGSDDVRREIIFLSGQTCGRNGRADGGLGKHLLVDKIRFCGTAT
ncbi:hypothetical protein AHAS_Ahas13G0372300 [Arachis hypogaea]